MRVLGALAVAFLMAVASPRQGQAGHKEGHGGGGGAGGGGGGMPAGTIYFDSNADAGPVSRAGWNTSGLFSMDADGSNLHGLGNGDVGHVALDGSDLVIIARRGVTTSVGGFRWSPDGAYVLYNKGKHTYSEACCSWDIFQVKSSGKGKATNLTGDLANSNENPVAWR